MDWVSFDYKHSLSQTAASARLSAAAAKLGARYQLEVARKKGRVDLSGKLLRGHALVQKDRISVEIELVGPVTPTKSSIEAGIRKALDQQFH
jgi:putative polyhydroxyalkanoate system protein